jgi:hypothetical protein
MSEDFKMIIDDPQVDDHKKRVELDRAWKKFVDAFITDENVPDGVILTISSVPMRFETTALAGYWR